MMTLTETESAPESKADPGRTILVVDDSSVSRRLAAGLIVGREGWSAEEMSDGAG